MGRKKPSSDPGKGPAPSDDELIEAAIAQAQAERVASQSEASNNVAVIARGQAERAALRSLHLRNPGRRDHVQARYQPNEPRHRYMYNGKECAPDDPRFLALKAACEEVEVLNPDLPQTNTQHPHAHGHVHTNVDCAWSPRDIIGRQNTHTHARTHARTETEFKCALARTRADTEHTVRARTQNSPANT